MPDGLVVLADQEPCVSGERVHEALTGAAHFAAGVAMALVAEIVVLATALGGDGAVLRPVEVGERGVRPRGGGIGEQRDKAAAFDAGLRGQPAEFGQGGEKIDETDGAIAHPAGTRIMSGTRAQTRQPVNFRQCSFSPRC